PSPALSRGWCIARSGGRMAADCATTEHEWRICIRLSDDLQAVTATFHAGHGAPRIPGLGPPAGRAPAARLHCRVSAVFPPVQRKIQLPIADRELSAAEAWDRYIDDLDRAGQAGHMGTVPLPALRGDLPTGTLFSDLTRADVENLSRLASSLGRRGDVVRQMWDDLRKR